MNVRYVLEYYERTALEALRDDPNTSDRLRVLINCCYSYRWELLSEWIEMTVELRNGLKKLFDSRYPHLLLRFNDLLPPPLKLDLQNILYHPDFEATKRFVQHAQDRFRNQQEIFMFILSQLLAMESPEISNPNPVFWDAVTRMHIVLWGEEDLLREFLQLLV